MRAQRPAADCSPRVPSTIDRPDRLAISFQRSFDGGGSGRRAPRARENQFTRFARASSSRFQSSHDGARARARLCGEYSSPRSSPSSLQMLSIAASCRSRLPLACARARLERRRFAAVCGATRAFDHQKLAGRERVALHAAAKARFRSNLRRWRRRGSLREALACFVNASACARLTCSLAAARARVRRR